MKHLVTVIVIALLATNVWFGRWIHSSGVENGRLRSQVRGSQAALTNSLTVIATKDQTVEVLSDKVSQLTRVLTNATAQLRAARETIRGYEAEAQENQRKSQEAQSFLVEVPPPEVSSEKDKYGREVKTMVFPKVLGRNGELLATTAPYGNQYGRRVSFRPASGPISVDVERLHPAILRYLAIDTEAAKRKQEQMDSDWRAKEAGDYRQFLAHPQVRQAR